MAESAAKTKIRVAKIPYQVPSIADLPEREAPPIADVDVVPTNGDIGRQIGGLRDRGQVIEALRCPSIRSADHDRGTQHIPTIVRSPLTLQSNL